MQKKFIIKERYHSLKNLARALMVTLLWGKVFRKVNCYQRSVGKKRKEQGAQLSPLHGLREKKMQFMVWDTFTDATLTWQLLMLTS